MNVCACSGGGERETNHESMRIVKDTALDRQGVVQLNTLFDKWSTTPPHEVFSRVNDTQVTLYEEKDENYMV